MLNVLIVSNIILNAFFSSVLCVAVIASIKRIKEAKKKANKQNIQVKR